MQVFNSLSGHLAVLLSKDSLYATKEFWEAYSNRTVRPSFHEGLDGGSGFHYSIKI